MREKILDICFIIVAILATICTIFMIFDPYVEWLIHKILRIIGISILIPITVLNLIRIARYKNEEL